MVGRPFVNCVSLLLRMWPTEMAPEYLEPLHELEESLRQAQEAACEQEQIVTLYNMFDLVLYVMSVVSLFSPVKQL